MTIQLYGNTHWINIKPGCGRLKVDNTALWEHTLDHITLGCGRLKVDNTALWEHTLDQQHNELKWMVFLYNLQGDACTLASVDGKKQHKPERGFDLIDEAMNLEVYVLI